MAASRRSLKSMGGPVQIAALVVLQPLAADLQQQVSSAIALQSLLVDV